MSHHASPVFRASEIKKLYQMLEMTAVRLREEIADLKPFNPPVLADIVHALTETEAYLERLDAIYVNAIREAGL